MCDYAETGLYNPRSCRRISISWYLKHQNSWKVLWYTYYYSDLYRDYRNRINESTWQQTSLEMCIISKSTKNVSWSRPQGTHLCISVVSFSLPSCLPFNLFCLFNRHSAAVKKSLHRTTNVKDRKTEGKESFPASGFTFYATAVHFKWYGVTR